jgi:hypothetical protein
MIRIAEQTPAEQPAWHDAFLALLPGIIQYAEIAFRRLKPEARQDALAEVVAVAVYEYVRLFEQGRLDQLRSRVPSC